MGKIEAVLTGYAVISLLSSLLLIIILYVILWKTPKEMKVYKWLLVNIQALEACLHAIVYMCFGIAITYRYRQLSAIENNWYYRYQDKICILQYFTYISVPLIGLIIAYIAILPDEESRLLVLKLDSQHEFYATVGAFSDLTYIWGIGLLLGPAAFVAIAIFIVYDSGRILRNNVANSRSAAMHKEAINALIIQISLMITVSIIGCVILGSILAGYRENKTNPWTATFDTLLAIACCFYASKSIACSLAIVAHKPYRIAIKELIWKREPITAVGPIQTWTSQ